MICSSGGIRDGLQVETVFIWIIIVLRFSDRSSYVVLVFSLQRCIADHSSFYKHTMVGMILVVIDVDNV